MKQNEQVVLRPVRESDLADYVRWLNDPEVTAFTIREFVDVTLEGEWEWFARKTAPDSRDRPLAIEVKGRLIGGCEILMAETEQVAFYGIFIGDKSEWSKGYGTAATREALRIGFAEMGLQRIFLQVGSHNPRGIRCYEKAGFRVKSIERNAQLKRGAPMDVLTMVISREEWEGQR